ERERLVFSWKEFCDLIKYKRRFFFLHPDDVSLDDKEDEEEKLLHPAELLKTIAESCQDLGLIVILTPGTTLFRVRKQESKQKLRSALDLGPPPRELATTSSRMSPAGVVMTYMSEDPVTAVLETAD